MRTNAKPRDTWPLAICVPGALFYSRAIPFSRTRHWSRLALGQRRPLQHH